MPPCPELRPDDWDETHRCCGEFVDRWNVQAHDLGWDTLRLFRAGPKTGAARADCHGILIPLSADVHEVTAERIKHGKWMAYRHELVKMPGMTPI